MKTVDWLPSLEVFVRVVELESFSKAARLLGVSKSHVSRQLSRLEDRLGARLLHRTTRRLSLTEVGGAFYERCAQILMDAEEAEASVTRAQATPRGTLRVTAPVSFGRHFVFDAVADFMARHAGLQVDLNLSDRTIDLVEEGYDIAIRIGELADSTFIARRLAPARLYLCASPEYLERRGTPTRPEELSAHDCLLYRYRRGGPSWSLRGSEGEVSVRVHGPMRSNSGDALLAAARRGLGLALLPDFTVADDLRAGRLVALPSEWTRTAAAIWLVYPHSRHLSAKVRVFVDYLLDRCGERPPWCIDPADMHGP